MGGGGGKQVFVKQKFRVFFSIYFLIPNDQWVSGADNSILRSISHIYMQKIFFSFLSVVWMIFIWNLRACVVYSMLFFSLKATHTHHIFRRRKNNDKQKKRNFSAHNDLYTHEHMQSFNSWNWRGKKLCVQKKIAKYNERMINLCMTDSLPCCWSVRSVHNHTVSGNRFVFGAKLTEFHRSNYDVFNIFLQKKKTRKNVTYRWRKLRLPPIWMWTHFELVVQ